MNTYPAKQPMSPHAFNMRRVLLLRGLAIIGQCMIIAIIAIILKWHMPIWQLATVIIIEFAITIASIVRLTLQWPITNKEFFVQLLADVAILVAFLYLSGGPTNPFVALLLLPLVIAVTTLPEIYCWSMAVITVTCYSGLMAFYIPLPLHALATYEMKLHIWGMWFEFVMIAGIISYFVKRMGDSLHERDQAIARAREEKMAMDRVVDLGALAAGVAHELGTPLATMTVITKDLQQDYKETHDLSEGLGILYDQLQRCKRILSTMSASTGQLQASSGCQVHLEEYLSEVVSKWGATRPGINVTLHSDGPGGAAKIVAEHTLTQALTNIFNNAADESPDHVEVDIHCSDHNIVIDVCDLGHGVSPEIVKNAGQPVFSKKEGGLGLGLFLATTVITRLGGSVSLFNRQGGGSCTRVILPLTSLLISSINN
ncbi:ATP-binding protein [Acidithiobacillus ferriphilus]|uniref:ATP-binding protein n=1 Tax=Acidithiobacillus ferriphilus TaxID=1689834 RepID=UPI00232F29A8|nr:ATP-binding protein [Acidithiobacillus ferriphilus]WCE92802.1 ATP-binding protein [Acidithiobacillus ferriphilus]